MSDVIVMISETRYLFFVKLISSFNVNIEYFSMVTYTTHLHENTEKHNILYNEIRNT